MVLRSQERAAMNEAAIRKKIDELQEVLRASPLGEASQIQAGEGERTPSSRSRKDPVEDALDYLRLMLKYLLFDLEATRRENRYLRQMLESRPPSDRGGDGEARPPGD